MISCCKLCYDKYLKDGEVDELKLEEILRCRSFDPIDERRLRSSPCLCECHEIGSVVFH